MRLVIFHTSLTWIVDIKADTQVRDFWGKLKGTTLMHGYAISYTLCPTGKLQINIST